MQWYADAKIGLFIHWGPYAIPGGVWEGMETPGMSEHIRSQANIPRDVYEKMALSFNPDDFDPDGWAGNPCRLSLCGIHQQAP